MNKKVLLIVPGIGQLIAAKGYVPHGQVNGIVRQVGALIGIAAPLVCLAVFGSGSFLLPAMACILVLLLALRKPIEKAEGTEADKRKEETGV